MKLKFRDPISGLSHAAGALLGLVGMFFLLYKSASYGTALHVISYTVFGVGLVALYTSSAFYHLLDVDEDAKKVYRRLDHAMIFLLIAASYTPFCLIPLKGVWGWSILTIIWALTFIGIVFAVLWADTPDWLRVGLYLFMGWLVVIVIIPLARAISTETMAWLCIGGAFYTVGALIYALKWPDPVPNVFGFHEIWHFFVLGGSASHFVAVYLIL